MQEVVINISAVLTPTTRIKVRPSLNNWRPSSDQEVNGQYGFEVTIKQSQTDSKPNQNLNLVSGVSTMDIRVTTPWSVVCR